MRVILIQINFLTDREQKSPPSFNDGRFAVPKSKYDALNLLPRTVAVKLKMKTAPA